MKVLLVQARDPRDLMLNHELQCVRSKLDGAVLVARNAYMQPAGPRWLDGVDAVLLGGSGDFSVHHPLSRRWVTPIRHLIDAALDRDLPGFGICFGHQLLGLHFGGEVVTDPVHEEVGTVALHLTDDGRECPLFSGLPRRFHAHTGHSDHVPALPAGLLRLASGKGCPNQAFRVAGRRFWSAQFHPDLTGAEARSRYLANKRGPDGRVPARHRRSAEAYATDRDEAADLLARFVALARGRKIDFAQ